MPDFQRALHETWARLWFESIRIQGREYLPASGPVLYLALHRNGIVDGFVHECVLRAPTYMISAQWKQGLRGLFFDGICVVREKDAGDASKNADAITLCVDHLKQGGELGIFPEGTSSLGPRHLPFKTGAARTLAAYLETGGPITVLPVGLHYERAWAFRSKVEVVVGPPLDTALNPALNSNQKMRALHQRVEKALEGVGINVADEAEQALVESLASAATLGTDLDYFHALKVFEKGVPEDIRQGWKKLDESPAGRRALRHQGIPLVPKGPVLGYALALALLGPWVPLAVLLNLPPFLLAYWAGKKLPDGPNVIALWRILVGFPALVLWGLAVMAAAIFLGHPWWILAWALLTTAGILSWYRVKKLAVAVHNAVRCGGLREPLQALHARVVKHVAEEFGK